MRRITKGTEPTQLTNWKRLNPHANYSNLGDDAVGITVRQEIKRACLVEQKYICAYCCDRITETNSHNEHLISQAVNNGLSLTFINIVASCNGKNHCGHFKGNDAITLTPLMPECEVEVKYQLNGKMSHANQRSESLISVVGLQNKALVNKRKELVNMLIINKIGDELHLLDNELLELLADDLLIQDVDGKLEAFSPVLACILRNYIF
jgi:uncharacterized protein (TIGR02646 family)